MCGLGGHGEKLMRGIRKRALKCMPLIVVYGFGINILGLDGCRTEGVVYESNVQKTICHRAVP
jgi:hypothetical protein